MFLVPNIPNPVPQHKRKSFQHVFYSKPIQTHVPVCVVSNSQGQVACHGRSRWALAAPPEHRPPPTCGSRTWELRCQQFGGVVLRRFSRIEWRETLYKRMMPERKATLGRKQEKEEEQDLATQIWIHETTTSKLQLAQWTMLGSLSTKKLEGHSDILKEIDINVIN